MGRPGGVGEMAFLRVPRECFYGTTRVNSAKWEKEAGKWGLEGISSHIQAILRGFVGRNPVFGQPAGIVFEKQTP